MVTTQDGFMISPASSLRRRVERLDAAEFPEPRLTHAVSVLADYTNTMMAEEIGERATLNAGQADDLVDGCLLIDSISRDDGADLITGPLRRDRQLWVADGLHDGVGGPDESQFVSPRVAPIDRPSPKPFGIGLHTATATRTGPSMWQIYLEPYYDSDLFPLPWYTWRLTAADDATVLEITSAREWTRFVEEYALLRTHPVSPDWRRVAADVDGLHMTLRAVVATQGFRFRTGSGDTTAAAYWDVESTLWLNWSFTSAALTGVIPQPVSRP